MRPNFTRIALLGALTLGAASAQAADNFVGLTWGQTNDNIQKSSALNANLGNPKLDKVIDNTSTFGVRAGQQHEQGRYYLTYENVSDSHSGYKLRQQNLLGSYDLFVPVGEHGTRAFVGGTLGLIKLEQESRGFKRDSDIGYAAGVQVGLQQPLTSALSVETGYRYLQSNASTEMAAHGGGKLGSLDLNSSRLAYLGVNYAF